MQGESQIGKTSLLPHGVPDGNSIYKIGNDVMKMFNCIIPSDLTSPTDRRQNL